MPRLKKVKEVVLKVPPPIQGIREWLIVGIDPSLSRTGYALLHVHTLDGSESTSINWLDIGSLKPEKSSDPDWIRSKGIALSLRAIIMKTASSLAVEPSTLGLIISFEYPTTMNTHLTSLNRVLKLMVLDAEFESMFGSVRIQETNAATLRSMMGLTMKGSKNKAMENIPKAYTFVEKAKYPELDTDSCDAVLLSIVARYTASIMLGFPGEVPTSFLNRMCDSAQEMKGKGRNAHIIVRGLLHRPEYWLGYKSGTYQVLVNNAANSKKKLERTSFTI